MNKLKVKANKNSKEHGQENNILIEELNMNIQLHFVGQATDQLKQASGLRSPTKVKDNLSGKDNCISKKHISLKTFSLEGERDFLIEEYLC